MADVKEEKENFIKKIDLNTKQKIIVVILAAFILMDIVIAAFIISNQKYSSVKFISTIDNETSVLYAMDSAARKGLIKNNGNAVFKFSEAQKKQITEVYENNETASIVIRLKIGANDKQKDLLITDTELPFNYGLLYEKNYDKKGKLNTELNKIISIHGDLHRLFMSAGDGTIDISMSLLKDEKGNVQIPQGFFINSMLQTKIISVCGAPALLGYDVSTQIPFYGFTCNGGLIDFSNSSADFSSASMVFPVENTLVKAMPQVIAKLSPNEEYKSDGESSVRVKINYGGEKIWLKNVKNVDVLTIPSGALKDPFSMVDITENSHCLLSFIMKSTPKDNDTKFVRNETEVYDPIKTDPGLLLKYSMKNWRVADYEVFQWDKYSDILFFDTRNYAVQDNFFRRLAYFVEKEGYKGRLISNEELGDKHGYNAHDYSAESLAKFYQKVDEEHFELNKEEIILRKILIKAGLLIEEGNSVKAGNGGIVSISQETLPGTRANLLAHEGWHTLFFKDEAFRNYVAAVYYTLDQNSFDFLIDFFKSQPGLGYDTNDEYLMHNEFMAYILQQPLSGVAKYFVHLANRGSVINYTPVLAAYVRKTEGRTYEDAALMLNDFVFDNYGIVCGNIGLIQR